MAQKISKFFKVVILIIVLAGFAYIGYVIADLTAPSYTITFDANSGEIAQTTTTIKRGHTIELPTPTREGYDFVGWYVDGQEWTENTRVKSDSTLTAMWTPKKYDITFIIDGNSVIKSFDYDSMPSYDGTPYKAPTATTEFVFEGFEPELSVVKGNTTYTAIFKEQIRHFDINVTTNYEGACTITGAGKKEYNSSTIISFVAETGFLFAGYYENNILLTTEETLTINEIKSDRNIEIRFQLDGDNIDIQLVAEGVLLSDDTITIVRGDTTLFPSINSSNYGMNGYEVTKWYLDNAMTQEINFDTHQFIKPTTLYGKWEYAFNTGFFAFKDKFDNALTNGTITINSEKELRSFIEYVQFNNIGNSQAPEITIGYTTFSSETTFKNHITEMITSSTYYNGCQVRYSYPKSLSWVQIYIDESETAYEASKSTPDTGLVNQLEYALLNLDTANVRSIDFSDFNIEKISNTIAVSNSTQLIYALEKGYRPIPENGSIAEAVYSKAKTILRQICNDDMSDVEKVRAIYDYLILNVQYDYNAAQTNEILVEWNNYRSWFAEGALLDGKAVCDGFCKAFIILAEIENIPAIRVTGNSHAWNRVYVNNAWYGIDATHGNVKCSFSDGDYEILTYANFMFTDEYKTSLGYTSTDYTEYAATTEYDTYSNQTYGTGEEKFSLLIESRTDFENMLKYLSKYNTPSGYYKTTSEMCTFEIALGSSVSIYNIQSWASQSGLNINSWISNSSTTQNYIYCFRITKTQLSNINVL